jgi:hypothetical protein
MVLYIIEPSQGYYTGTVSFRDLDGSGQINVYDQIITDLTPTIVDTEFDKTLGWRVIFRAITRILVDNYDAVNKYSGYPDRYNFGQLRWLRGGYAEQLYYIDTHFWFEPRRHAVWIAANEERTPGFGDPWEVITSVITTDLLLPLSQTDLGARLDPVDGAAVDQIAYYIQPNLTIDIGVTYVACSFNGNPSYGIPDDITLFQL